MNLPKELAEITGAIWYQSHCEQDELPASHEKKSAFLLAPKFSPLYDGDIHKIGVSVLKVIHTPGHTNGSISILVKGMNRTMMILSLQITNIIAVPLLIYVVGISNTHIAIGTSALAVAANSIVNLLYHKRKGHVNLKQGISFAVPGAIGTVIGTQLGLLTPSQSLLALFAVFMAVISIKMLIETRRSRQRTKEIQKFTGAPNDIVVNDNTIGPSSTFHNGVSDTAATTIESVSNCVAKSNSDAITHKKKKIYHEVMGTLESLGMPVTIWTTPVEVQDRTPFEKDEKHAAYDPKYAQRIWRIMAEASKVFNQFRSRFVGKVSQVHFFWGAFDLAVTRFSGRTAPPHPGAPNMARFIAVEAYSHEVSSCGFWPGGGPVNEAAFYAYAYPEPQGFKDYPIRPQEAFYHKEMGEFLLPYDVVRNATSPDNVLLSFLQTTYEAAATCAKWDRQSLERQ